MHEESGICTQFSLCVRNANGQIVNLIQIVHVFNLAWSIDYVSVYARARVVGDIDPKT